MVVNSASTPPTRSRADAVQPLPRNPGPGWGYRFLRGCDRALPEFVFRPLRALGTWIALTVMPAQRRHSREYLRVVLGREPSCRDVFRHFFAFEETLMLKLRVVNGRPHRCDLGPDSTGFRDWLPIGYPVMLGTFHLGVSDLLGFMLGGRERRLVHLVRLRVGNSHDTEQLAAQWGEFVRFVWVNDPAEMLFAFKEAAAAGGAIALQCDRVEFSARTAAFEFFGARRLFPFSIYELARVLQRPVILSVGVQESAERSVLIDSPVFPFVREEARAAARARAHAHFQAFLHRLETLLRAQPYLWFNFTPFNPPVPGESERPLPR